MVIEHAMPECTCSGKFCKGCKRVKCTGCFSKHPQTKDRLQTKCKACCKVDAKIYNAVPANAEHHRVYSRAYYAKNIARHASIVQKNHLKYKYNLTPGEKQAMLEQQEYTCAISACSNHIDMTTGHVDHNHDTGVVRGLLCFKCNLAIGLLQDRPDMLLAVYHYLTPESESSHEQ